MLNSKEVPSAGDSFQAVFPVINVHIQMLLMKKRWRPAAEMQRPVMRGINRGARAPAAPETVPRSRRAYWSQNFVTPLQALAIPRNR